ncbi:GDSL esterase/lipase At1g28580-like [Musa acuminata AAA Group]|uniref:GDSL esterase/lipase At1g28580-like n=1 Tax=Musa acuminata AAA Group TaxID=214697 RepID=UPI0031DE9AAE
MGVNDYNSVLVHDKPIESARALVAPVARAIGAAIDVSQLQPRPAVDLIPIVDSSITDQLMLTDLQALVRAGAKTVFVSGIFPMGCIALFLTETQNAAPNDPETGCLKWLNEFSQHHNLLLRRELRRLRRAHPHSTIIYDDIYRALMAIYMSPSHFGEPQTAAASRDYEFISSWLSE